MDKPNFKLLAAELSKLIKHPETPVAVCNLASEFATEISNYIDFNSPEVLEIGFRTAFGEQQEKPKTGKAAK